MISRVLQVNQLIKRELSRIILREIEFPPGVLATVTRVETTANLIETRVFMGVMPEEKTKDVLRILGNNIYDLQQEINRKLEMRPVPKIIFIEEKKTKEAGRIEEILEDIKNKANN
mgnify:CR=1 FL=1